jgi:hypothetical protein
MLTFRVSLGRSSRLRRMAFDGTQLSTINALAKGALTCFNREGMAPSHAGPGA